MAAPVLLQAQDGAIATLTLNRPEKMNALSRELISALSDAVGTLSADRDIRAIIVTGAGRAFCGGVDLKELSEADDVASSLDWQGAGSLIDVVRACPHPMIAAVNGFAVTGGLELALMADFILAAESARFADTHARVGITPSWGMTQILPRLIGLNRARQMSLTGEFLTARRAEAWGLVNEVVADGALLTRARELAEQIAESDRSTMTRIRDLIGRSAETGLSHGLAEEAAMFRQHIGGVTGDAVAERRKAVIERGRRFNKT